MSEKKYVEICLNQISKKMEWVDYEHWTHFHFTKLSDKVSSATKISVSFDTLKRLAGKKRMSTEYTPRAETKEALALFLGYTGWEDFMSNCDKNEEPEIAKEYIKPKVLKKNKSNTKRALLILCILTFIFALATTVWLNRAVFAKGRLLVESRIGDGPHTSMLYYTVSGVLFGSVYLDWGYEKRYITFHDKLPVKLQDNRGSINQCYFIPGWYIVKLKYGDMVLDTTHVHITTANQWRPYIILPEKNDIMLNLLPTGPENEITFSKKEVEDQGFKEADSYWTELRFIKETGLKSNNFEWIADVKNETKDAIICKDFVAEIQLTKSMIRIHFVQPGCTQFSEIQLPNKALNGRSSDLSFLGIDFSTYKRLKIISMNSKITFWLDDVLIYEDFMESMESIEGFVLKFKGCGSAKNISFSEHRSQ